MLQLVQLGCQGDPITLIRLPSGRRQADEGQTVIFATDFDKNDEVTTPIRAECDKSPLPLRHLCQSAVHTRSIKLQQPVLYPFITLGTFYV
jgi:hypothetical protein